MSELTPLVTDEGNGTWSVKAYYNSEYKADWAVELLRQHHTLRLLINAVRKMLDNTKAHDGGMLIRLEDFERLSLLGRQQSRDFLERYEISQKDLDELAKIKPPIKSGR